MKHQLDTKWDQVSELGAVYQTSPTYRSEKAFQNHGRASGLRQEPLTVLYGLNVDGGRRFVLCFWGLD
jgi:hypothetical protein